ncbi:TPA: hypothetical protein ACOEBF_004054 [Stenotrophomonas maltophilia]|uniref:hypothetical protein n=1 Tax=Stenotrophomonas TaxID=40323 RepID=UPI001D11AE14|nr:hypothetical protein [Stenotrophomonas maltophilia]EKU9965455.1 hypothetical protein [Stenotrophomonas maltophilia]MCU1124957.1 hypothetical protein [Stenotrophomonas maltophilia]UXF78762.1 hypothetical protein K7573_21010 [Stenotrophomonas maltophilia]
MTNTHATDHVLESRDAAASGHGAAANNGGPAPHPLAQVPGTIADFANDLVRLNAELAAMGRLHDPEELRRRAGWAAETAQRAGLDPLHTELLALSRLQDDDELRRRAGWAAAEADELLGTCGLNAPRR